MTTDDQPARARRSDRRRRKRAREPEPVPEEQVVERPRRRSQLQRDRRRERRRERGRRTFGLAMASALVVAAAFGGVALRAALRGDDESPAGDGGGDAEVVDQQTLLLVTPAEGDPPIESRLIVLLSSGPDADTASLLLIPGGTLAEVPGHGLQLLRDANVYGGAALVGATVENLLGIDIDATTEVSHRDWTSLFTRVQPLEVEILDRLVTEDAAGGRSVAFLPGVHALDAEELADLLLFRNPGESELDALPRGQRVLDALLAELVEATSFDALFADGAPMLGVTLQDVAGLFAGIVAADQTGGLDRRTLPVSPVGDASDDAYRPDTARIESLVADHYAASVPTGVGDVRDLQVLNGDGRPGLGARVAELLVPAGFRVALTGNADTFDHRRTLVIIYREDEDNLAAANRIVELLGVGQVQISNTTQSVADITIVIGSDFSG